MFKRQIFLYVSCYHGGTNTSVEWLERRREPDLRLKSPITTKTGAGTNYSKLDFDLWTEKPTISILLRSSHLIRERGSARRLFHILKAGEGTQLVLWPVLRLNGREASLPCEKAQMINDHFCQVFTLEDPIDLPNNTWHDEISDGIAGDLARLPDLTINIDGITKLLGSTNRVSDRALSFVC